MPNHMTNMREKGIAQLLILVVLLVGLVVGIYIVQQDTNPRPQASTTSSVNEWHKYDRDIPLVTP